MQNQFKDNILRYVTLIVQCTAHVGYREAQILELFKNTMYINFGNIPHYGPKQAIEAVKERHQQYSYL